VQLPTRRRVDRSAAATVFGVAAAAMLVATMVGDIAPPLAARRDPRAAAELVALMQRGERSTFVADYVFTRSTGPGPAFSSDYSEARNDRFHVTRSGSSLDIDTATRHYDCELVEEQPSCSAQPLEKTVAASEVLRIAVALGAYDVTSTGDRNVSGEQARCFQVRAHDADHALPGLGFETDTCYTADGVRADTRVRSEVVEQWVARRIVRSFNAATIAPILSGFDQTAPPIGN
jgi:hypothetical protein